MVRAREPNAVEYQALDNLFTAEKAYQEAVNSVVKLGMKVRLGIQEDVRSRQYLVTEVHTPMLNAYSWEQYKDGR